MVRRSVFFPCRNGISGGGPVSGPLCERKLRSERHGTTTVAGPTRKLFFTMEKGFFSVKAGSGKAWPLRQVAEKTTFFPKRENGKDFFCHDYVFFIPWMSA